MSSLGDHGSRIRVFSKVFDHEIVLAGSRLHDRCGDYGERKRFSSLNECLPLDVLEPAEVNTTVNKLTSGGD